MTNERRNFLKASVALAASSTITACAMGSKENMSSSGLYDDALEKHVKIASNETAPANLNTAKQGTAHSTMPELPPGIIFTKENPGKWAGKVGGHAPIITVSGNTVTVKTDHGMSSKHYIVRHTIVTPAGEIIAAKTFSPNDLEAVSIFEIDIKNTMLYATSFCNKHDMWVETFNV